MKKLTKEETKEIIGGATSGAAFSGIASVIGKLTDFVIDVAAIPLVYIESSKQHDKAKFKMGSTTVEFDDSISAKNKVIQKDSVINLDNQFVELEKYSSVSLINNMVSENEVQTQSSLISDNLEIDKTTFFG